MDDSLVNRPPQFQRTADLSGDSTSARELARAQYGPYLMGLNAAELGKLTIEGQ